MGIIGNKQDIKETIIDEYLEDRPIGGMSEGDYIDEIREELDSMFEEECDEEEINLEKVQERILSKKY